MLTQRARRTSVVHDRRRMQTKSRSWACGIALAGAVFASVLLAAGCASRRAEPVPLPPKPIGEIAAQPATGTSAPPVVPAGARAYLIDGPKSVVTIRVHRAGPLAKLGHNHVVTTSQLTGWAWQGRDPAGSGFEIHVPVASLVVDDPAARAAAGPGFEADVPDSARKGTYQNMLRPEVLDGAAFPEVVVRAASLTGTWDDTVANADLTIRGVTRRLEVPVSVRESEGTLAASGSLRILQSDFGITPFSVAGGAIQVADELELDFAIVANAR